MAVALLMLVVSWRWRNVGRGLFVVLFLWAAQVNMRLAIWNPAAYLEYARWAIYPYADFIRGPFARHTSLYVAAIAVGQLGIGVFTALRGRAVTLGLAGAIVFLLAIAPLGRGSAFPFSLVASLAAALLLRHRYQRTLISQLVERLRHRRVPEERGRARSGG